MPQESGSHVLNDDNLTKRKVPSTQTTMLWTILGVDKTMKSTQSTVIKIVLAVLLCVYEVGILQAQETTGTIQGRVLDQAGSSVPGVNLTLTNVATGVKRNAVTQPSGDYYFNALEPGAYSLTAESAGFRTAQVNNLQVQVALTTTTNVHLEVGQVSEVVTVTGAAPLINTVDAQVTTTISKAYVEQLGSQSRNALSYADMSPGVTVTQQSSAGAAASLSITGGGWANINGSFSGRSSYYLDGIDSFGAYRNYALQFPSPDAVQEVMVSSSNGSAQYGAQSGGSINVVTKSGASNFHGDAFYFFSPVQLSANSAGNKYYHVPRVPNHLKEVGGTLGGPIIRKRTFFFVSYQRYSNSSSQLENSTRPGTPAMMLGDFGDLLNPASGSGLKPVQLYDPNFPGQTQPIPNDNLITYISPVTGASLLNPVGLNLAKLMPTVSTYGNQYLWQFTQPQVNNEILAKIDQSIASNQHLIVTYFGTDGTSTLPGMGNNWNNVPDYGPELDKAKQFELAVHYAWTKSSELLIEPFFSFAFQNANRTNAKIGNDLSTLGAMNVPDRAAGAKKYLPDLNFNGMTAGEGWLSQFNQHNYQFGSTVTWLHGQHQSKFGFSVQNQKLYQYNDQDNGGITFNGAFATGVYGVSQPNDTGSALADLLIGHSESFKESGILEENDYNWNTYYFAQDQWKLTPRLTLSPGIRYEIYSPTHEASNRFSLFQAGYQSSLYPNAYLGIAFPGDPNIPSGLYKNDYTDFGPRLGLAWDVNGDDRTAVRAGLGWFYSTNPKQNALNNSEANPWYPSAGCQSTIISNPWLDCNLPTYATPPAPFSVSPQALKAINWQNSFGSISGVGYSSDFKTPYSLQWNIAVEHEFAHHITVSTGYVGDRGYRLTANIPLNWAVYSDTASHSPANVISRQPYSSGAYAGNGAGLYTNGLVQETAKGEYHYNGWQSTVIMRPVGSLQIQASYEYARAQTNDVSGDINNGNVNTVGNPNAPFASWGTYLPRQTFKAFYLWQIPFPAKNLWLNRLAGGWHLTGDVHAFSGSPSNITLGYDWEYDGLGQTRPSLNGPIQYSWTKSPQNRVQYLNVGSTGGVSGLAKDGTPVPQRGSWTVPGGGTDHSAYGNAPLNSVFLPGTWSADTTLLKDFHLTDTQYAEFRFEGYNIFNHEAYGCLDTKYTDPQFGQLTCNYGGRTVQLGLKYYF